MTTSPEQLTGRKVVMASYIILIASLAFIIIAPPVAFALSEPKGRRVVPFIAMLTMTATIVGGPIVLALYLAHTLPVFFLGLFAMTAVVVVSFIVCDRYETRTYKQIHGLR